MKKLHIVMLSVLCLGLLASGCGKKEEDKKTGGKGKTPSKAKKFEIAGTVPKISGMVVYDGSKDVNNLVVMKEPTKDQEACPAMTPREGWYVTNKETKGVQYAVVFLQPPSGVRSFPPLDQLDPKAQEIPDVGKDGDPQTPPDGQPDENVLLSQPNCQFEPRVLVLHPKQNLRVINDSAMGEKKMAIQHDANIQGANSKGSRLQPGQEQVIKLSPSDRQVNLAICGIHEGMMKGYIWKFTHPFAAVTDKEGKFSIENVALPKDGKLRLYIWHELISTRDGTVKVMDLDLKSGEAKDVGTIKVAEDGVH